VRKRRYSDDARRLLILVWSLMGRPNSKYFAVMRHEWMPLLQAGGDLQQPSASRESTPVGDVVSSSHGQYSPN
jgi:hypothetical protein